MLNKWKINTILGGALSEGNEFIFVGSGEVVFYPHAAPPPPAQHKQASRQHRIKMEGLRLAGALPTDESALDCLRARNQARMQ